MTEYFRSTIADGQIPTFSGAAEVLGISRLSLEQRCQGGAAWRECEKMLADYLMVGGLTKRFDASLVRQILQTMSSSSGGDENGVDAGSLLVTVHVVD